MREITGYVFAADFGSVKHLFGKIINPGGSDGDYENLIANGLTPYDLFTDARRGAIEFRQKRGDFKKIELGQISVEMAETQEEAEQYDSEVSSVVAGVSDTACVHHVHV